MDAGAPLTFKGGSSILLLLKDNLNRLSIDVDVICPPDTYILQYLNDLEKHGFPSRNSGMWQMLNSAIVVWKVRLTVITRMSGRLP